MSLSRDQWLYCLRVGLAVSIAYALAHGPDPTGGLYAILGAGLVQGANVGEGIGISRNRIIGTLLGVAIGIPVASVTSASVWSIGAACVAASVAGMATGKTAVARIAITVAAVTVLLHAADATLYGLFRLTNTAMGVAIAIAVSYLLWPITGHEALRRAAQQILSTSGALALAIARSADPAALFEPQRAVYRALAALPKATDEAGQDPLRRAKEGDMRAAVVPSVTIATSLLAASVAAGQLDAADRQSDWWDGLGRAFVAAGQRLREAAESPAFASCADAESAAQERSAAVRAQSGPFSCDSARAAVLGMLQDLRQTEAALKSLREAALTAKVGGP